MGLQKYQVCPVCGRTLKKNIENFKKYTQQGDPIVMLDSQNINNLG